MNDIIETAKKENWMICTYGLGYLGRRLYEDIPSMFGLSAGFYSDGNNSKVDSIELIGMKRIYKDDLINIKHHVLVFILVDDPYDIEIQKTLSVNNKLHTFTLRELVQMESIIRIFYGDELFDKYEKLPDYSTNYNKRGCME